ncbi:MAG: cysteine desulfurase [Clostridiales bacterium]|nr:cysteine desulfurase [Clostridiales bacterium]
MTAYLDNAATTMVCPEAAEAALQIMTVNYGNPSSTHTMGRNAKKALETARAQIADAIGAKPEEIFFTSCGSESDNWAILSGAQLGSRKGKHIISSMAEHSAVLKSLELLEKLGYEVTRLKPEKNGSVPVAAVEEALREDTILVSLMLVNNETGGITDIAGISRAIKKKGSAALLHTDAVQGFLKVPFTVKSLGADLITLSGHKIHAPKGVGALYARGGAKMNLAPLILGGGQEQGRRSGTEPLPQIAAFGVAAELGKKSMDESISKMAGLKALAVERLTAENEGLRVLVSDAPHILSISLPGYKSEVMMNFLEARGVFVSKSSACKKGGRSYVLEAAGCSPDIIDGALRIGLSRYTTEDEIAALCDGIHDARERLYTVLR